MAWLPLSEKIGIYLIKKNLPIWVETLFGFTTRPWILDPPGKVPKLADYAEIAEKAELWCSLQCYNGGNTRWQDFTMEELSCGIGVPASMVRNWFQLVCETDFRKWKMSKRILIAQNLLEEYETIDMTMVAERAGFHDTSNFSRQFRKFTGCSPSEYHEKTNEYYGLIQ